MWNILINAILETITMFAIIYSMIIISNSANGIKMACLTINKKILWYIGI